MLQGSFESHNVWNSVMCKLQNGSFRLSKCKTLQAILRRLFSDTCPRPPDVIAAHVCRSYERLCYVVLFIMLCKVIQHLTQVDDKIQACNHLNESYGAVLSNGFVFQSYNTLYKVVLIFKSGDETLVCDHSNESYWAVLSCGTSYLLLAMQGRYWAMIHINIVFSSFRGMI